MKQKQVLYSSLIFILILLTLTSLKKENQFHDDFLEFWTDVKDNYAYFDKKYTDWDKVKILYLPQAEKAKNTNELITVFENALEELYDNHFSLNTNLESSTRLVPTGLDIWAEWINNKVIITEVRKGFSAEKAGVKNGMEILSINGIPIEQAVHQRIGKCISTIDTEVKNYALRQLLAGTYLTQRTLVVKQNDKTITLNLDAAIGNLTDTHKYNSLLEFKKLHDNMGYIKFNNSLGETDVVQLFDNALDQLKNTNGLIIDLRETPSGGNSILARGIMSRFIKTEMPYQKHVLPNEEKEFNIKRSWFEIVSPRGPFTYEKSIIILVNHWTGRQPLIKVPSDKNYEFEQSEQMNKLINGVAEDKDIRTVVLTMNQPEITDLITTQLRRTIEFLRKYNKRVIFIYPPPHLSFDPIECVGMPPFRPVLNVDCAQKVKDINGQYFAGREGLKKLINEVKIKSYDTYPQVCNEQDCQMRVSGGLLYRTNGYLTTIGSEQVFQKFEE